MTCNSLQVCQTLQLLPTLIRHVRVWVGALNLQSIRDDTVPGAVMNANDY